MPYCPKEHLEPRTVCDWLRRKGREAYDRGDYPQAQALGLASNHVEGMLPRIGDEGAAVTRDGERIHPRTDAAVARLGDPGAVVFVNCQIPAGMTSDDISRMMSEWWEKMAGQAPDPT